MKRTSPKVFRVLSFIHERLIRSIPIATQGKHGSPATRSLLIALELPQGARFPCWGFLPRLKLVCCKVTCCNIAINLVGVWLKPPTKSLAHLLSLFAVKEVQVARLFVSPYVVGGSGVVSCFAAFRIRLFWLLKTSCPNLFPLNRARRLTGNVIHHAVDFFDAIDNAVCNGC